jgi:hypothetical protein
MNLQLSDDGCCIISVVCKEICLDSWSKKKDLVGSKRRDELMITIIWISTTKKYNNANNGEDD